MTPRPFLADAALARLSDAFRSPELSGTKYRLIRQLGAGGMGTVWEVADPYLSRTAALKVLDIDDLSGELEKRLIREARILARLEHPGMVPIHDIGHLGDGRPFYVMKLVHGVRLDEHAEIVPQLSDRLRLFLRVCEPVAFAHAHGVLHRDLKPQNIMVGPFGEVLVLDWGLAKVLGTDEDLPHPPGESPTGKSGLTGAGRVLGTPGFMAPEQERGEASLDARADVFSLGKILDGLLETPGPKKTPDRRLLAICERATSANPGDRYPDVPSLMADAARFLDGQPVAAYRERFWEKGFRVLKRHRIALLLLLSYLFTRALVLFFYRH